MNAPVEHLITNSRVRAYLTCQRLHWLRYCLGYRGPSSDEAQFGSLFHAGLEAWWLAHRDGGEPLAKALANMDAYADRCESLDESGHVKARIMMHAYDGRWSEDMGDLEVLAVEQQFTGPLSTPKGKAAKGLKIAGKLDGIVRRRSTGQVLMIEHKTAGADLSAGSSYWQRLRTDSQISMYHEGAAALGYKLDGCIYDVIVRPAQRMLLATPEEVRKYTKAGALYANQRAEDETLIDFEIRLAAAITEDPNRYFARADVVRLDTELTESKMDVYYVGAQIRNQIRTGIAPRNTSSCLQYGHDCEFLSVCSGMGSLEDKTKYTHTDVTHPELEAV